MHITARNEFTATPHDVVAMFRDEEFLAAVARLADPVELDIVMTPEKATVIRSVPLPEKAQKFAGKTMTMVEVIGWKDGENGQPAAAIEITVPSHPVRIAGVASLTPEPGKTVVEFDGEIEIHMPFIGRLMERELAPYIQAEFGAQQRVGNEYLSRQQDR